MKHCFLPSLALLLAATAAQAQQPMPTPAAAPVPASAELDCRVLTGRVTDRFAYPLTGVSVMLRSRTQAFSTEAFITNAEGQYIVTAKQGIPRNAVLKITAAGYNSIELPLANCQPQEVTLEPLPGTRFKADGRIKKTAATGKVR